MSPAGSVLSLSRILGDSWAILGLLQTLIHAVDDEIFDDEQQALFVTKDASPR